MRPLLNREHVTCFATEVWISQIMGGKHMMSADYKPPCVALLYESWQYISRGLRISYHQVLRQVQAWANPRSSMMASAHMTRLVLLSGVSCRGTDIETTDPRERYGTTAKVSRWPIVVPVFSPQNVRAAILGGGAHCTIPAGHDTSTSGHDATASLDMVD